MKNIRIIQVSEADMNELLDPLSELFDKYRQFYKQPSNQTQSKSFIRKRIENQDSVINSKITRTIFGLAFVFVSFYWLLVALAGK